MKFQPGDLVTYLDQFTQSGNFDGSTAMLVLKTVIPDWTLKGEHHQRVYNYNLKTGIQGWDFAHGYVKMPAT